MSRLSAIVAGQIATSNSGYLCTCRIVDESRSGGRITGPGIGNTNHNLPSHRNLVPRAESENKRRVCADQIASGSD